MTVQLQAVLQKSCRIGRLNVMWSAILSPCALGEMLLAAVIYIHNPGQWRSWGSHGSTVTSQNYSNEECSTTRTDQVKLQWGPMSSRKIFLKVFLKSNLPFQLYTFFLAVREFFWALLQGRSRRGREVWRAKRRWGTERDGNMRLVWTRNTRQHATARTR